MSTMIDEVSRTFQTGTIHFEMERQGETNFVTIRCRMNKIHIPLTTATLKSGPEVFKTIQWVVKNMSDAQTLRVAQIMFIAQYRQDLPWFLHGAALDGLDSVMEYKRTYKAEVLDESTMELKTEGSDSRWATGLWYNRDRYYYDNRLPNRSGWAQYDTHWDAPYYGIWVNARTWEIVNFAEGDASHRWYGNEAEFVRALQELHSRIGGTLDIYKAPGWEDLASYGLPSH